MENDAVPTMLDKPGAIHTVELLQRRRLSKNAIEIELTRPSELAFKAGQTVCFIHESKQKYYSLLSPPDDPTLSLCVYHVSRGSFSPVLASAKIGTHFNLTGPHGYFAFKRTERTPVFVATGTGIAPFVSMGRSGVTDFMLLHEVKSAEDLYYQDLFRNIASNYVPCLSEISTRDPVTPKAFRGKAVDFLKQKLPPASYDFYLCGERDMTSEVTLLADEQFPGSYVFKEVFF